MTCSICGASLETDGDQRPLTGQLCPACQSTRPVSIELAGNVHGRARLTGKLVDYPDGLMQEADALMMNIEKYGLAIVVAHTACEIATQSAFRRAILKRGLLDLEEVLAGPYPSYNLKNDRMYKVYTTITGDDVRQKPWWKAFTESLKRRNDVVHRGTQASQEEARDSLNVCATLIDHLRRNP
jgi:hypothetical protein